MSYSNNACQNRFSDGQVLWMRDVTQGPRSNLLYDQTAPVPFPSASWSLLYPSDNDTINSSDSLTFQWEWMPNADFYLLEFGRQIGANLFPILTSPPLNNNYFKVAANASNLKYYWRVYAVNGHYPCDIPIITQYFSVSTVSGTNDIKRISLKLFPNPASLLLYWQLPDSAAEIPDIIQVIDMQGTAVQAHLSPGTRAIDIQNLPPGLYTLRIAAGERVYVGRFVKQ